MTRALCSTLTEHSRTTYILLDPANPTLQDNSGTIEREEFLSLPQVSSNPLATRMIAIFDEDGGGDVDFKEFVSGLSAFSSKGNKEEKLRFAFKVYDIDRDGYISNGELFIVLKMMVGSNLKDQQLQQVCGPLKEMMGEIGVGCIWGARPWPVSFWGDLRKAWGRRRFELLGLEQRVRR